MRNTKLFLELAEKIRTYPGCYDQQVWGEEVTTDIAPCGTRACIAGHTCLLVGLYPVLMGNGKPDYTRFHKKSRMQRGLLNCDAGVDVAEAARDALGITDEEAKILFSTGWRPYGYATVPDALTAYAFGAEIR